MESETIKEIKECLEVLNEYGETYITKDRTQRKFVNYADILTYINELESENKDLQDLCNKTYDDLTKEIDRLEKEIKGNVFYAKGYAQGIKNTYEVVMPNKLKQFAERVKMEFYYEFDEIIPSIMSDKIDKILKEILGE